MSNLIKAVMHEGVHSVTFEYKGIQYIISGYWMIEGYKDAINDTYEKVIPGTYHFYPTKQELIEAKIFDGKSLTEIVNDIKILDVLNDWD